MISHCSSPVAAYAHVPFCAHRCGYCDFTLVAGRDDLIGAWLEAMRIELARLERPRPVKTLFVGGGTPTQLPPGVLREFLELLQAWFPLAPGGEFSVEANPGRLQEETVEALAAAGVNRVSLGVQSFHARHLETLERDHREADIHQAYDRVRSRIKNVSIDLIFAVPGQSHSEWVADLEAAISLGAPHVSTYGLTYEKGTAYWTRRSKGELQSAPEELERAMYGTAIDRLTAAGFEHYELSNFARPGARCRHNEVYWSGEGYWGVGPGAASYVNGVRRSNHRSVTGWIRRTLAGEIAVGEEERLNPEERAREAVMLGLRKREGIDLVRFTEQHGRTLRSLAPEAYDQSLEQGLLEEAGDRLRLTREGCFVADAVISAFL